jgi:Zn-dependent peptidase ImmA (M78 family)
MLSSATLFPLPRLHLWPLHVIQWLKSKGESYAQRAERTTAASRCDRCCCHGCTNSNRRNTGHANETLSPARSVGGRQGACGKTDQGRARGNRQKGGGSAVGVMSVATKAPASIVIPRSPRWDLAKREADKLTSKYTVPPIPVIEIAETNGVDVVFADFGRFSDDVAGLCNFAAKKIFVNKDDIDVRQYFTIAHELGHWILHRDIFLAHPDLYPVLPRFQNPDKNNPLEKEANQFAANLLVPEHLLRPVKGASVSALASVFMVSKTMMEYRVQNVR